ncbi:hypothetical protein BGZ94_007132 [Podila epigama]|nr:hypothetical protein BGZ94_007132 [Podila epigama]
MEHCSEQDDVHEREFGEDKDEDDEEDEEEQDEDEDARSKQAKRKRLTSRPDHSFNRHSFHSLEQQSRPIVTRSVETPPMLQSRQHQTDDGDEDHDGDDDDEDLEVDAEGSKIPSATVVTSSPSLTPKQKKQQQQQQQQKQKQQRQTQTKTKLSSGPRQTSVQVTLESVLDQIDEDAQGPEGSGVHSQGGRGLRFFSQRVCDKVQAKGATTYNNNIRRRVYDALNVLEALDIISMDKKEIQWIGVEKSKVLNDPPKKDEATKNASDVGGVSRSHRRELDEESEEPEDDDMDIEQLQREVDALRLRNELERAQLHDQVSRHVHLTNLVARNKLRESKEQERIERRKQRRAKREEEKLAQVKPAGQLDPSSHHAEDCDPVNSEGVIPEMRRKKKSERRHRHRSSRDVIEDETGEHSRAEAKEDDQVGRVGEGGEEEEEEEEKVEETKEERRARRQARRERRERKEKRSQRRSERDSGVFLTEDEKIQMPFVVVRIPRYAGQSSDSEASISVVRRVRSDTRPKKSGKSKRQGVSGEETTMVEIQMPHQEEMCIISDTEILGDLGLGTVSLTDLKAMLPNDLLSNARYVVHANEATVHGGFERELVCSV